MFNLKNIYLDQIYEPEENTLRLLFSRSRTSEPPETITIGKIEIKDTYSIDVDETLPLLQMDFEWYIDIQFEMKVTLHGIIMKNLRVRSLGFIVNLDT